MAGLDEGTVDYHPTYNGEDEEPEIFPGLFPNLLANGAAGRSHGEACQRAAPPGFDPLPKPCLADVPSAGPKSRLDR